MSEYKIKRDIKLSETGLLVGSVIEEGEIKLEGFEGSQGTFITTTIQHFDKEGTRNLPKYVEQSEAKTQEQLVKVKADLTRIGPMKIDAEKKKQSQQLIALWRQSVAKPEMKRLQDRVADKIGALNQDLTKEQQYDMLKPQEKQLMDQLKQIKGDLKLIEDVMK